MAANEMPLDADPIAATRKALVKPAPLHVQNDQALPFDVLRIAAVVGVVVLHVSAYVVTAPEATLTQWWWGNIGDSACRWCVPVFVLISGALLLGRPVNAKDFYKRRAARLLPPLVFWTLFYLGYRYFHDPMSRIKLLIEVVYGQPYYHLWFLYMIAGLYAVVPLLNILIAHSSRTLLTLATAGVFLIASVDRTVSLTILSAQHELVQQKTFLVLWLPFTAYFLAGYILVKWPPRVSATLALTGVFLATALIAIVTSYCHSHNWQDPYVAYDCFNPLCIGSALLLFAGFSQKQIASSAKMRANIHSFAGLTLGIYLIHPFWLKVLETFGLTGLSQTVGGGIPLTALTAFVLSALTAAAFRATPLSRHVV